MDARSFASDYDASDAFKLLESQNIADVQTFVERLKEYGKRIRFD